MYKDNISILTVYTFVHTNIPKQESHAVASIPRDAAAVGGRRRRCELGVSTPNLTFPWGPDPCLTQSVHECDRRRTL